MRRRTGELLSLEIEILGAALQLFRQGQPSFYGFALAKQLQVDGNRRQLTAYGTLYRALSRLEHLGYLRSGWEPEATRDPSRPTRRLYRITGEGQRALAQALVSKSSRLHHVTVRTAQA